MAVPRAGRRAAHAGARQHHRQQRRVTLYELALQGLGIIRLSDLIVGPAIPSGRLVPILVDSHQPEPLPLHAVYVANRRRPPKVDAVIQFLVEKFASVPWRLPHPVKQSRRAAAGRSRRAR